MDRSKVRIQKRRIRFTIGIVGIVAFFILTYFLNVTHYVSPMMSWILEHKNHLRQDAAKAKQLVLHKREDEPIHFEFYTSLPSMQVEPSNIKKQEMKNSVKQVEQKIERKNIFNFTQRVKDDV